MVTRALKQEMLRFTSKTTPPFPNSHPVDSLTANSVIQRNECWSSHVNIKKALPELNVFKYVHDTLNMIGTLTKMARLPYGWHY
jgi:hypothetical protein